MPTFPELSGLGKRDAPRIFFDDIEYHKAEMQLSLESRLGVSGPLH